MLIKIGTILLKGIRFLARAWGYHTNSSYRKMVELAKRWNSHPEEFITLEELELEVLKDWEFNNERD